MMIRQAGVFVPYKPLLRNSRVLADLNKTTRPCFGLIDRTYETDSIFDANKSKTQWERFTYYIQQLNAEAPSNVRYKMFYIARHGEGIHNVKERAVGRLEWEVCFYTLIPTFALSNSTYLNSRNPGLASMATKT